MNNEAFKQVGDSSQKYCNIGENLRYGAHFEYQDLVDRLNKVKKELERKAGTNSSMSIRIKNFPVQTPQKRKEKKNLSIINTERFIRNASISGLPQLKTPKPKKITQVPLIYQSDSNLRIEKLQKDIKLHPLAKRPSLPFN